MIVFRRSNGYRLLMRSSMSDEPLVLHVKGTVVKRLVGLALAFGFVSVVAASAQTLRVTADRTNLRDKPATEGKIVAVASKGDELEVLAKSGSWYRARLRSTGAEGYINELVVEIVADNEQGQAGRPRAATSPAPTAAQPSTSSVQARSGPVGGFELGANFANLSIDTGTSASVNPSTSAGLLVGGFATIPVGESISLQPEFLFVQRKFDVQSGTSTSGLYHYRWSAVEIPILARFGFAAAGERGFYAVAGPGFSFLVSAAEVQASSGKETLNYKDEVAGADVSIIVGAGLMFGKLGVEARYNAGLREVQSSTSRDFDPRISIRNRAFALLVRYHAK